MYMYVYMHIIRMCVHQAHYSLARRHPGMTSTRFLAIQPMNKCARHKNPDEANTLRPDSELLTHTTHGMHRGQVHAFRRQGKGSKLLELAKHQTSKSIRRQIDHRLYNLQDITLMWNSMKYWWYILAQHSIAEITYLIRKFPNQGIKICLYKLPN